LVDADQRHQRLRVILFLGKQVSLEMQQSNMNLKVKKAFPKNIKLDK
jgi:hypothetical protein